MSSAAFPARRVAGAKPEPWSPMRLQTCSQMWFDPILRDFALSSPGVELRHRTQARIASQDTGDGVTAEIVDLESGKRERIEADYLVGCDGATSAIRGQLGIGLTGQGVLGHPLHLFFRAPDLLKRVGKAEGTFFLAIDRDGLWANIRVVDPVNAMWRLMVLDSDGKQTPETIDKDALIRRAVGRPIDVEWVGMQHLDAAQRRRRAIRQGPRVPRRRRRAPALADRRARHEHRHRRCGRSRLEACRRGRRAGAAPNLLASYDSERRPIGVARHRQHRWLPSLAWTISTAALRRSRTTATRAARCAPMSVRSWCARSAPCSAPSACSSAIATRSSPIIVPDGTPPTPDDPENFVASARPGSRAPHVALADGSSMLDLYGRGFVLVRLGADAPDGADDCGGREKRGVPLRTVTVDEPEAAAIYERKLVLVRPDGHVAWRGDRVPADALALIDRVRGA